MGGGPGLSKAAQIARAAERGGSAKRATRQARAHATGNQNNRRQKRDGRTHGTAWNYGVPERLGQHAGCGPRRVPRPHQAAHGAGRGRHPRKGGRHHRKGASPRASLITSATGGPGGLAGTRRRDFCGRFRRATPACLAPTASCGGDPDSRCKSAVRATSQSACCPVAGSEKFRVLTQAAGPLSYHTARACSPLPPPPHLLPRLYWRLAAGPCSHATYLSSCSSSGSAVLRLGRIGI